MIKFFTKNRYLRMSGAYRKLVVVEKKIAKLEVEARKIRMEYLVASRS